MRTLRRSPIAKGICSLILAASVALAAICGWQILWRMDFATGNDWQDNGTYDAMSTQRYYDVKHLFNAEATLALDNLDYMDKKMWEGDVQSLTRSLSPEYTNYRYEILSDDGKTVLKTNLQQGETLKNVVIEVRYDSFDGYRANTEPTIEGAALEIVDTVRYIVASGVVFKPQVNDEFYGIYTTYQSATNLNSTILVAVCSAVVAGLCLLYLLWSAGYRRGNDTVTLDWWGRLPLELYLVAGAGGVGLAVYGALTLFGEVWTSYWYGFSYGSINHEDMFSMGITTFAALGVMAVMLGATVLTTITARLRCGKLLQTTMCYYIFYYLWRKVVFLVNSLPVLWRVAVLFFSYVAVNFGARYGLRSLYPFSVFLVDGLALGLLLWWTYSFRRVRDGADAIAEGNLTHRVETARLPYDLRSHAESINNISLGMESAVDSRIKSERFKAELITNVSHDLKTPLTSIINYVDLLKTTEQVDPHAAEYIEVLERKSQRLKKLTEDLVEASKASTGALKVEREKIGVEQLLDQAMGEYHEKLESKGLTLVTSIPEGESFVMADGRHLWRVIDNLLGNCVKYALEGTRVYVELVRRRGQVELSVKNISREPLTVTPEQLVERFVRGDEARTTEGSGLGLSIAKSLTELQGGTFQLIVDGDLFKAIVVLPQAG